MGEDNGRYREDRGGLLDDLPGRVKDPWKLIDSQWRRLPRRARVVLAPLILLVLVTLACLEYVPLVSQFRSLAHTWRTEEPAPPDPAESVGVKVLASRSPAGATPESFDSSTVIGSAECKPAKPPTASPEREPVEPEPAAVARDSFDVILILPHSMANPRVSVDGEPARAVKWHYRNKVLIRVERKNTNHTIEVEEEGRVYKVSRLIQGDTQLPVPSEPWRED